MRDIIVIGTSAGGIEALKEIAANLPHDFPAAVFAVLHMSPYHRSYLAELLNRNGNIRAVQAKDGVEFERGMLYVSVPDYHLILEQNRIRLVNGPKENRHRPSVDPLFRSAAYWFGPRVIGIILTGSLDDGTSGLLAIKQRGGIAIVQDPVEAAYPGMPLSALRNVDVDYKVNIADIPKLLSELVNSKTPPESDFPMQQLLANEYKVQEHAGEQSISNEAIGIPSSFSCPECGGVLWEIDEDKRQLRFRCRVGHAFTVDSMMEEQSEAIEKALWSALKTLEESAALSRKILNQTRANGYEWLRERYEEKLARTLHRADQIRKVLVRSETLIPVETKVTKAPKRPKKSAKKRASGKARRAAAGSER